VIGFWSAEWYATDKAGASSTVQTLNVTTASQLQAGIKNSITGGVEGLVMKEDASELLEIKLNGVDYLVSVRSYGGSRRPHADQSSTAVRGRNRR
jgi:hypothetical protein